MKFGPMTFDESKHWISCSRTATGPCPVCGAETEASYDDTRRNVVPKKRVQLRRSMTVKANAWVPNFTCDADRRKAQGEQQVKQALMDLETTAGPLARELVRVLSEAGMPAADPFKKAAH